MTKLIVEQLHNGIYNGDPIEVLCENAKEMLEIKFESAENKGWSLERTKDGFHAWKEYTDGDGTMERPNRKDRYFRLVK